MVLWKPTLSLATKHIPDKIIAIQAGFRCTFALTGTQVVAWRTSRSSRE